MKSGYTTSEFYLCCGAQLSAFITALNTNDPTAKIVTGVVAAASVISYLYSRHQLKMTVALKEQGRISPLVPPIIALALVLLLGSMAKADHHPSVQLRFGFHFGAPWYYQQPIVVAPPPVVVAPPPQIVIVDPNRPYYPAQPVYLSGNIYFQYVPGGVR